MFISVADIKPKYDLIIIGSGFGSLFYLEKLRQLSPKTSVLILEWGSYHTREWQIENLKNSKYNSWEEHDSPPEQKPWVYSIGLGGGTNCWWAQTPRMLPNDFRLNSKYGVGEDWPVSYEQLSPYYREAEKIMSISGADTLDTIFPNSAPYPQPPHRMSTPDEILSAAHPGFHFPVPSARMRIGDETRSACLSAARCNLCPVNAKFAAYNSSMHLFEHHSTDVILNAKVDSLDIQNNIVTGVNFTNLDEAHTVKSERVVLGANAIQSPYILQKSGLKHPALGKYLHEKMMYSVEVFLDGVSAFDGGQATSGIDFSLSDTPSRADHGAATLYFENRWTTGFRTELGRWREVQPILIAVEDIPQESNTVSVTNSNKPFVDHNDWSNYAHDGLKAALKKLPEILKALPVEKIHKIGPIPTNSHIQGTLRMGKDPAQSIVGDDLKHHSISNLLCVGTSVWPSCSSVNPSLTAAALSLRAAEIMES